MACLHSTVLQGVLERGTVKSSNTLENKPVHCMWRTCKMYMYMYISCPLDPLHYACLWHLYDTYMCVCECTCICVHVHFPAVKNLIESALEDIIGMCLPMHVYTCIILCYFASPLSALAWGSEWGIYSQHIYMYMRTYLYFCVCHALGMLSGLCQTI